MNLLWIKIGGLWPLNTGGRLRTYHTLKELSKSHNVTLLTTHAPGDPTKPLVDALPDCEEVISHPLHIPKKGSIGFAWALARSWLTKYPVDLLRCYSPEVARDASIRMQSTNGEFDLCIADFLAATINLQKTNSIPVVLFEHNVEYNIWKRLRDNAPNFLRRTLLNLEWRKMRRIEIAACRNADMTIAVSNTDKAHLENITPGAWITAVDTGVDTAYFSPENNQQRASIGGHDSTLVFTGSMDWYPNEDAVEFFKDKVLQHLIDEFPDLKLTVVGRNPSSRLTNLASRHIEITGTVPEVLPYMLKAAVYVVPLRIGGGTRLKIVEALAAGKAIVSTTIGAEGLRLTPDKHFIRADAPEEFANAIASLLRDPSKRKKLGRAGRELVTKRFTWPQIAKQFEGHLQELLDRR